MACIFTLSGIPYAGCDVNLAGVKNIYIGDRSKFQWTESEGVVTLTTTADNTDAKLYTYVPAEDTASLTKTLTRNDSTGTRYFTNEVVANFNKMDVVKRNEMMEILNGELIVVVEDNNDICWFLGYDKRVIATVMTGQTGASADDGSFYSMTLTDRSAQLPFTVNKADFNNLIA